MPLEKWSGHICEKHRRHLFAGVSQNKKSLTRIVSRTNKSLSVVPPCFTALSRKTAFERANTRLRCHGRPRRGLKSFDRATPRPCSPIPSAPLSHQPGLSVPYLTGYSSLHRLLAMFTCECLQYTPFFCCCQVKCKNFFLKIGEGRRRWTEGRGTERPRSEILCFAQNDRD